MPLDKNRQFLDFEKPIKELFDEIEKLRLTAEKTKVNLSDSINKLYDQVTERRRDITANLTPWQKVQLSRHPDRPYTMKYIEKMTDNFVELFGDRNVKDDKAMIGGLAQLDGETVMIIGQQKGTNTKMRQYRNFGMANPEGYRKALRLMKLAEKFNKPIITLIDTPGAFPGMEAEERGQGEAIARNIYEMIRLRVPVIVVIIGEGASGGALGIGVGDKIFMLENSWYTVISPENCSSILWRSWDQKEKAAEELRLTPENMYGFGLIDEIVPEPIGGAHWDYNEAAALLKPRLIQTIQELKKFSPEERINNRIEKFNKMGFWDEHPEQPAETHHSEPEPEINEIIPADHA
ncbi:MAG TPA: acetyl-CoA carboxylase carboxyltransferase subunit alpha [Puia sp.]|nr:acetyl-CoA carboxylase carboxyltransferase subunit alpha [Puia sp.]